MLALPIFPARLQASIFGRSELNFRVRNGNGWTLVLINTDYMFNTVSCAEFCCTLFQGVVVTRGRVELPFAA